MLIVVRGRDDFVDCIFAGAWLDYLLRESTFITELRIYRWHHIFKSPFFVSYIILECCCVK